MGDSLMPGNALFAIAPAQAADDGADGDALGDAPSAPAAAQVQSSAASDEDFERALADLDATLPLPESSATSAWDDGDAAASAANAQDLVSPAAHEASLQAAAAPDTAGSGTLYDADDGLADGTDDASETKLDLAQAYIDIGDNEAAHALLDEVLTEGNAAQRLRAERLLADLR